MRIPDLKCDLSKIVVIDFVDASQGSMPREGSQLGVATSFANPKVLEGTGPCCLMEWMSSRVKRVVRSSMACEAAAVSVGFEHGDFARAVLFEMLNPDKSLRRWQDSIAEKQLYVVMDARTVFDAMETSSMVQDRRVMIDLTVLRDCILSGTGAFKRWLPGPLQPSDELTKFASNGRLSILAATGEYHLQETEALREERLAMKQKVKERKEAKLTEQS